VSVGETLSPSAARCEPRNRAALVAAYREGLGLAAVAVLRGAAGIRIVAAEDGGDDLLAAGDAVEARWWCRRAADAERVATAATARLRRRQSSDGPPSPSADVLSYSPSHISVAIENAARRLHVILYSDEEIFVEAARMILRVDEEIENLQRAGQLKSLNKSYRTYRTEASARGEKVPPYAEWLNKYKANLMRQLAAALRYG
jgi:hypothetical protein